MYKLFWCKVLDHGILIADGARMGKKLVRVVTARCASTRPQWAWPLDGWTAGGDKVGVLELQATRSVDWKKRRPRGLDVFFHSL